ncbi:hypothetical protein TSUD_301870 [Trifolium subterraneum]|uniref:Uncharacterized protein n=1 Tax=Trifolium subterraneum TaxID=3900 RepID=A0A2Z6P259_TRISU|nr:hypothetical protein TSUD_301870 [Trifolium subterraneum]
MEGVGKKEIGTRSRYSSHRRHRSIDDDDHFQTARLGTHYADEETAAFNQSGGYYNYDLEEPVRYAFKKPEQHAFAKTVQYAHHPVQHTFATPGHHSHNTRTRKDSRVPSSIENGNIPQMKVAECNVRPETVEKDKNL